MAHVVRAENGWQTRATQKGPTKFFGDLKYGDSVRAHEEACKLMAKWQVLYPTESRFGPRKTVNSRNKSGIPGIGLGYRCHVKGGEPYLYVWASWTRDGVHHNRTYSVDKLGALCAVTHALQARACGTGVKSSYTPRQALRIILNSTGITLRGA